MHRITVVWGLPRQRQMLRALTGTELFSISCVGSDSLQFGQDQECNNCLYCRRSRARNALFAMLNRTKSFVCHAQEDEMLVCHAQSYTQSMGNTAVLLCETCEEDHKPATNLMVLTVSEQSKLGNNTCDSIACNWTAVYPLCLPCKAVQDTEHVHLTVCSVGRHTVTRTPGFA